MSGDPVLVDLADVSSLDRDKVTSALARVRIAEIRDGEGADFDAVYAMLEEGFAASGELEERSALAGFVKERVLHYAPGVEGSYHLIGVWDGDTLVAVRDCYVDLDLNQGLCLVALAHTFVAPAWRRTGVAAALRALPVTLARRIQAERLGGPLPTLVVAEMEPVDPEDPATVVRLLAYGRSGFSVLDPRRVRYSQPEFRDLGDPSHTGIPLLGVVRALGVPGPADEVPERVAASFPALFYVAHRRFLPGSRVDPSEAHVRLHLEVGGAPVPLLPLPTSTATLDRLAPLVRGAVLPLYPPGLRGPEPRFGDPRVELAAVLERWASAP